MISLFKNISLLDNIIIYPRYFYGKINDLSNIRLLIKNWQEVLLFRFGIKKHVNLLFKDGYSIKIPNLKMYNRFWDSEKGQLYQAKLYGYSKKIKVFKNQIIFKYNKKLITFIYNDQTQLRNIFGTIKENFVDEQFKRLNVKNKVVIDIGANVGDSAIYFALNHARKIYAFEPYPYSYNLALKNIKINKLNNKILIKNLGFGKNKRKIKVDAKFKNTAGSSLIKFENGKNVNIITLEDAVFNYKLKNAILKMDCEGCEYGIVLNSKNEVLQKFDQIMIEYHYGYVNIENKLKHAGFTVEHTKPKLIYSNEQNKYMVIGMIYASAR